MINTRPNVRLRVDWDNDGFINEAVPVGTPQNLIPYATYAAGAKCAYVVGTTHLTDTEVKDVNEYGFTKFQADMGVADKLVVGSAGDASERPNGADNNLLRLDDFMQTQGSYKRVVVPDVDYTVYETAISNAPPYGTSLPNLSIPNTLDVNVEYMFSMWVRVKINTADTYTFTTQLSSIGATSTNHTAQFTDSTLTNDTWSEWFILSNIVTFDDFSDYWVLLTSMTLGTISSPYLINMQVGGFTVTAPSQDTDTYDNETILNETNVTVSWDATNGYEQVSTGDNNDDMYFDLDTGITLEDGQGAFMSMTAETRWVTLSGGYRYQFVSATDGTVLAQSNSNSSSGWLDVTFDAYIANNTGSSFDVHLRLRMLRESTNARRDTRNIEINHTITPDTYYNRFIVPTEDTGHVRLTSGTAHNYSYQLWRGTAGNSDVDVTVYGLDLNTGDRTTLATDTVTVSETAKRFNMVIPSQGSDYMFLAEFTTADSITLNIKANQITRGADVHVFTVGAVPYLDDISQYVKSVDWKTGRNDFESPLAYEGTLDVVINNDNRYFSVNNTDSPYYGYMRKNLKTVLELEHNRQWYTIWTGWTNTYEITAGRTGTREMSMSCLQGLFRLRDGEFSYAPERNVTVKDVVTQIVANSGWRSAKTPFSFTLGFNAVLGVNTYLQATEDIFTTSDSTSEVLDLVGMDWGKETKVSKALDEILTAENAKMWIDREGGLVLRNRKHIINAVDKSVADITLDMSVQDAQYVFGEKLINRVEVVYEPKNEVKNVEIWRTKGRIRIPARNDIDIYKYGTIRIPMHFTFEEQRQRTITKVKSRIQDFDLVEYIAGTDILVGDSTAIEDAEIELPENPNDGAGIYISVTSDGGSYYELQIRNDKYFPVDVEVGVYGDYIEGGNPQTYVVEDIEAQEFVQAVHKETIKVSQIGDFEKAKTLADWLLERYAYPVGEFRTIMVSVHDDTSKQNVVNWQVGDIVKINEVQTGETNRYHIIIAEEGSYSTGDTLHLTYIIARASDKFYNKIGVSTTNTRTKNLAPVTDIVNADVFGADKADVRRVGYLHSGGEQALELRSYRLGGTVWFGDNNVRDVALLDVPNAWYRQYGTTELNDLYINTNRERSFYNSGVMRQNTTVTDMRQFWGLGSSSGWDVWNYTRNSIFRLSQVVLNMPRDGTDVNSDPHVVWAVDNTDDEIPNLGTILTTEYHTPPVNQASSLYSDTSHFTDEFIYQDYGEPVWIRSILRNYAFGQITDPIRMDLLKLNNTQLDENTTYYVNVWGASRAGEAVDIEIVILEHDDLTQHVVPVTFTDVHGKRGGTITTSASMTEKRCTVWFRFVDTILNKPIYVTGFSITEADVDTLTEANTENENTARIFV